MQNLLIFQSLWAMERRSARYPELTLEENIEKIAAAGFDGISTPWHDRNIVSRVAGLLKQHGLQAEGQCFPKSVDDLKPVLEIAAEHNVHHICLQPDVRLRRLEDCIPLLEGWQRLADEAGIDVWIETHRDRMTTDLFFTLDLLDRMPDLRLLGDISHFLVGREFAWPVSDENHALIHRILDSCWAFHGRVASREQVQIEISFPHHRPWVDPLPRLVGVRLQELAEARRQRRHTRLHLRVGTEALCDHGKGWRRYDRPVGGIPAYAAGNTRFVDEVRQLRHETRYN